MLHTLKKKKKSALVQARMCPLKGAHPDLHRLGLEQAALSSPGTRPGSNQLRGHIFSFSSQHRLALISCSDQLPAFCLGLGCFYVLLPWGFAQSSSAFGSGQPQKVFGSSHPWVLLSSDRQIADGRAALLCKHNVFSSCSIEMRVALG